VSLSPVVGHDRASTGRGSSDSITALDRSPPRKEVKRVNIETLEQPVEPAAAILKGQ
jgi:hypothetical protein